MSYSNNRLISRKIHSLPFTIASHTATLIPRTDKILIFGGLVNKTKSGALYEYDIKTGQVKKIEPETGSPMPCERSGHVALMREVPITSLSSAQEEEEAEVVQTEFKLVIFGGVAGKTAGFKKLNDIWEYSVNANQWQKIEPTTAVAPLPRDSHTAVYRPNEDAWVIFGGTDGKQVFNDLYQFSFKTKEWKQLEPIVKRHGTLIPNPRFCHSAVYNPYKDTMIIFGGMLEAGVKYSDMQEYVFAKGMWQTMLSYGDKPIKAIQSHVMMQVRDGLVVFIGGEPDAGVRLYALRPEIWRTIPLENETPQSLVGCSFSLYTSRKIIVTGGKSANSLHHLSDVHELSLPPKVAVLLSREDALERRNTIGRTLLNESPHYDFVATVPGGQEFKLHKCIIGAVPFFSNHFSTQSENATSVGELPEEEYDSQVNVQSVYYNVEASHMRTFIEYLYGQEVSTLEPEELRHLLSASVLHFQYPPFTQYLQTLTLNKDFMDKLNVVVLLRTCHEEYERTGIGAFDSVVQNCLMYINHHASELMTAETRNSLSKPYLDMIFQFDVKKSTAGSQKIDLVTNPKAAFEKTLSNLRKLVKFDTDKPKLTDNGMTTIVINQGEVYATAHKALLVVGSDYFSGLLGGNFSAEEEYTLPDIDTEGFKVLLNFIYGLEMVSEEDSDETMALKVFQIMSSANLITLKPLEDACLRCIETCVNPDNALTLLYFCFQTFISNHPLASFLKKECIRQLHKVMNSERVANIVKQLEEEDAKLREEASAVELL